ncbi:4-carboxy-4-hydroxy-2-oxoadipate aldolase/oxaloacetate decarboxylase [Dactylosporangium sp. NPDC051541]|uniref:4-carboxy-4-hydroxy-2-oxoadipate aldolase/oxaloacetate decarboxylase n=1 Tax=Dactylosporangium sp. NPDC051541 TaxID=3363977 RepID=UPI0037B4E8B3
MAAHYVVRSIDRAEPGVIAALRDAGVATVHEAAGRVGLLGPQVRARQAGTAIGGSAVTVSCHPGDNLMIHAAVEVCRPGDVLVVTTTSPSTDGMFGELLATSLAARGVVGLVSDAGVRDLAELRAMGFPVWSRAVHAQGTVKASPGSVNVPVVAAGRLVNPGDIVLADDDGVLALPAATGPAVAAAAARRIDGEAAKRERLAAGVLGVDLDGLRPLLDRVGVRYVERLPE